MLIQKTLYGCHFFILLNGHTNTSCNQMDRFVPKTEETKLFHSSWICVMKLKHWSLMSRNSAPQRCWFKYTAALHKNRSFSHFRFVLYSFWAHPYIQTTREMVLLSWCVIPWPYLTKKKNRFSMGNHLPSNKVFQFVTHSFNIEDLQQSVSGERWA